jgi:type IV pilus assembly protein PilB
MADPNNVLAMDDIGFITGLKVEPVVASEVALEEAIDRYYGPVDALPAIGGLSEIDLDSLASMHEADKNNFEEIELGKSPKLAGASPIVKLTNAILVDSLKRGASDIHIEPYKNEFRVRFRIGRILYNAMALPMTVRDPLTSRIMTMAKLILAEKHRPQRGRFTMRFRSEDRTRDVDFGVSVLPTLWGEKIVIRPFDESGLILDMTKLGFETRSLECFKSAIAKPYGVVLIGGPTGSGRSNTAYAALAALNTSERNVIATEDPLRFTLPPGINQVYIRESPGQTATVDISDFLVQDPDVVFLDGMNDDRTASSGLHVALTGHLVLSTFNATDAPSMVARLTRLGVDAGLVALGVILMLAQRLVRRICARCKVDVTAETPSRTLTDMGVAPDQIGTFRMMKGKGCAACSGTGYSGVVGLFEVMEISQGIRDLIKSGAGEEDIRKRAIEEGMITLRMSGLEKIRSGVTTIEEILRETVL